MKVTIEFEQTLYRRGKVTLEADTAQQAAERAYMAAMNDATEVDGVPFEWSEAVPEAVQLLNVTDDQ